jgi:actin-related protein 9
LAPDGKSYEPYKVRSRKKEKVVNGGNVEMAGADMDGDEEDEEELIELPEDEEGAVWPLKGTFVDCLSSGLHVE